MNVVTPTYLKTLTMFGCLNNEDIVIVMNAMSEREIFELEKEVVTFKALLTAAVRKEVLTMIDSYSLDQLQAYNDGLCSAARAKLEGMLPVKHNISRFIGENIDYSCFFECISIMNERNFKPTGRKLCPTLTTR